MTAPARLHGYTFDEYLDLETVSNVKHEYLEGEIYGMAGGTPRHAALTLAIAGTLLAKLRGGPCRAFSSDLRIPSLGAVLYVWQDQSRIELRLRAPDGSWSVSTFQDGDTVPLDIIGCSLSVRDVYSDAAP